MQRKVPVRFLKKDIPVFQGVSAVLLTAFGCLLGMAGFTSSKVFSKRLVAVFYISDKGPALEPVAVFYDGKYKEPKGCFNCEEGSLGTEFCPFKTVKSALSACPFEQGQFFSLYEGAQRLTAVFKVKKEWFECGCVCTTLASGTTDLSKAKMESLKKAEEPGRDTLVAVSPPDLSTSKFQARLSREDMETSAKNAKKQAVDILKEQEIDVSKYTVSYTGFYALDMDKDGVMEFPLTVVADDKTDNERFKYSLFVVFEDNKEKGAYDVLYMYLSRKDDETERTTEHVLGVLDINGDSRGELVTETIYFEGYDYSIYHKSGKQLKQVFKGAGGGC